MQAAVQFFKNALHNEVKAAAFYEQAAEETNDDESRMLFLKLADMEHSHARVLANKVKNAPCGQELNVEKYLKDLEQDPDTPISTQETDIIRNGSIRNVLELAIQMEVDSRDNYSKLADESVDVDVKSYCLELIREEQQHANALTNLLNSMDMSDEDRPGL